MSIRVMSMISEGDTTYCYECGEELIVRDWYEIKEWCLDEAGKCPKV